jgi:hypothetical protein
MATRGMASSSAITAKWIFRKPKFLKLNMSVTSNEIRNEKFEPAKQRGQSFGDPVALEKLCTLGPAYLIQFSNSRRLVAPRPVAPQL